MGLSLALSNQSYATNWVDILVSSKQNNEKIYADLDSIEGYYFNSYDKTQYYVSVWTKLVYPTVQKLDNGRVYREIRILMYYDCQNQKSDVVEGHYYKVSTGERVDSFKNPYLSTSSSSSWDRIVPGSIGGDMLKHICLIYDYLNK